MPARPTSAASELRQRGAKWSEILDLLRTRGESDLDLIRTVRDVDGLSIGQARAVIGAASGQIPVEIEVIIEETDPLYGSLFQAENDGATPDEDEQDRG